MLQVSDVWQWLGGPLLSSVFMDDFYSGRPFNTAPTMRAIFNSNIIVSAVTLRQKRVLPNSCVVPDVFLSDQRVRGCGSNLDAADVEDRLDHKARASSLGLAPAFMFNADMPSFQGTLASYSSGAYVHIINTDRAAAAAEFLGLESLGWIDNLTRALAVEISTFTPGSNIFSTLTLVLPSPTQPRHAYVRHNVLPALFLQVLEIPLGGSVAVSSYTYTSRLHRYITTPDYIRLGFELSSILLIILDLFEKLLYYPYLLPCYRFSVSMTLPSQLPVQVQRPIHVAPLERV